MPLSNLTNRRIVLASGSPRRKALMEQLGIDFEVLVRSVEEDYPKHLNPRQVAEYLARKKAEAYEDLVDEKAIVITADTLVTFEDEILNKPANRDEAVRMLSMLSDKTHEVITGVSIQSDEQQVVFHAVTYITFSKLSQEDIDFYVDTYSPFDKAGSYGIQEWIGLTGVKMMEGTYYNVVGLPMNALYHHLQKF
ncbi:septum formation protein Maf [bacterium SCSIO 12741]|nr:septum formation protein Maf [bacterium SCSIO 12741]